MFRFTPTPVSSASIFWWCGKGGFADRKCTLDDTLDRWFDARFPPLSIYYGGRDYLVLTEPLLDRIKDKEKHVELIKVTKLDLSEVRLMWVHGGHGLMISIVTFTGLPKPWNGHTSRLLVRPWCRWQCDSDCQRRH